jgi:hypothetical protein
MMMLVGGDNMSEREHDRMEQSVTEMEESLPNLQNYSWAKAGPFDLEAV